MKISHDTSLVITLLILMCFGTYYLTIVSSQTPDAPTSYSTGQHGLKALYMLLHDLGFQVARQTHSFDKIPKNAQLMFMIDPSVLKDADTKALISWVKKGNTLVLAVSRLWSIPDSININIMPMLDGTSSGSFETEKCRYSDGAIQVLIDHCNTYIVGNHITTIVRDKKHLNIIGEAAIGKGRVIAICDPLLLANSNIREEDNVVLVTNFVYKNVDKNGLVLFSEYHPEAKTSRGVPILGRAGKLAFIELILVAALVLISAGRRFGAVHPLLERTEQRRGWELVRAIAGLYRRAGAVDAAFASIYRAFRRELMTVYGVSPEAGPKEAADVIVRSHSIDRAIMAALLDRCDRVASGETIPENDIISLIKAIEQQRRELGIARSTNE